MKTYWAIGAALLVAGPIMALPSGRTAEAGPAPRHLVVDLAKVGAGGAVEIRRETGQR